MKCVAQIFAVGDETPTNYEVEVDGAETIREAGKYLAEQLADLEVLILDRNMTLHDKPVVAIDLIPVRNVALMRVVEKPE